MAKDAIEARIGFPMTGEALALLEWFIYELAVVNTKLSVAQRRIDQLERREEHRDKADFANKAAYAKAIKSYQRDKGDAA